MTRKAGNTIVLWGLFFLGFLAPGFRGNSQLYQKFEILTRQQGLSDNRVTCFLKDKKGFMWIGTRNGLNRYDGHDFTLFKPGSANTISNEVINDIDEDSSGKIWVATLNGLNCFDPETNQWQTFLARGADLTKSIPNPVVWNCFVDSRNRLWIVTDRNGPSVLETDRKTFRNYNWRSFVHANLPQYNGSYFSIIRIQPKNDKEIFLGSTIGLFSINTETGGFRLLGSGYKSSLLDMQYDKESKRVYLTNSNDQVFCYEESGGTFNKISPEPLFYPSSIFLSIETNRTWIGSAGGLLLADKINDRIFRMQHIPQLSVSIPPGGVNTIYHDNTGISWLATNNGVAKYDRNSQLASFLPLTEVSDKAGRNPMGAVYYDGQSDAYFVCSIESNELFIIGNASKQIERIRTDITGRKFQKCLAVKPDRNNQLWLLTGNAVYKYDRRSKQFTRFPTPNGDDEILFRDMVEDKQGNYWFTSFHGPVYYYDTGKEVFTTAGDTQIFSSISKSTCLLSDTINNCVWIGTFSFGLYRFDLGSSKFTLFAESSAAPHYMHLTLINDIEQDKRGRVWVATHTGGLFIYTPGMKYEKSFSQVSMKEGLSSTNIYAVTANDSLLWVMSGVAVDVLDILSGKIIYKLGEDRIFPFATFTSGEEMPHYTSFDKQRQDLLIGVGGGLMICHNSFRVNKMSFPVLLSSLKVNHRELADSLWKNARQLSFPFPMKDITIGFAALHYSLPGSVQYEYKLEGFDEDWKRDININEVTYQNLPPGDYNFRLRARDYAGNNSASVAAFSFVVTPPFWKTWWFNLLLILLISAVVYNWISRLRRKIWAERMLNNVATSLYGQHTQDDIFRDITRHCTEQLGFSDCIWYLFDESADVLIPRAISVAGKSEKELVYPAAIPFGKGLVGHVAAHRRAERVNDTARDRRFSGSDAARLSQLAVPLVVDEKLFGVIDSGHVKKRFFKKYHLQLMNKIASACVAKISRHIVEDKLRSKIARDLHDEMGSTLTSINIISKVAMEQGGGDKRINQQLEKIKENSSRMMESMSDMVWAINPANDTFEKVALRMKEFAAELLEPAGMNYFFREEGQMEQAVLNPGQRKDIYLIFKEVLNNAVKYSAATEIDILLKKENGFVIMKVTDNGKGFDMAKYSPGNGIKNIRSRAAEMKAKLTLNSMPGTGTTVFLQVPVTS